MRFELNNLGKRFGNHWVFRHLNFAFKSGEIYGVYGPNGKGKTTLLMVLSNYLRSEEGEIQYFNNEGATSEFDEKISLGGPMVDLIQEFTVEEHYAFQLQNGFASAHVFDLSAFSNRLCKHLSSGSRQKLKLNLLLGIDKPIILLDEPFMNLDATSQKQVMTYLHELKKDRIIIIASNRIEEVHLFDSLFVL
jgi:ABC-type multidrug transport system ATPase subunit